jgi:hypothetical protein
MRLTLLSLAAALLGFCTSANATVFSFTSDPFEGTTALTTPGRPIVGGEDLVSFDIANDIVAFHAGVLGS